MKLALVFNFRENTSQANPLNPPYQGEVFCLQQHILVHMLKCGLFRFKSPDLLPAHVVG
jgi:hypothetical protein